MAAKPTATPANELSVKLIEKSCMSHLFRHASEITRETKGGYLEGKILIPSTLSFPVYMRLSLIPSDPRCNENPFLLHPNLLHINMKLNKKNRKLNEGELPEDVDWVVTLKIEADGSVQRVCGVANQISEKRFQHSKESSAQADSPSAKSGENRLREMFRDKLKNRDESITIGPLTLPTGKEILKPVAKLETGPDGVRYLEMGNRGLMLNVITPLQKFSKGGATISDVLKQRFQDTFQREMSSELLIKTEEVFTKKKEDRVKLQLVRLLVEVFSTDQSLGFIRSTISATITNSKSKECGPLQLHDVNPATSCTKGNTKIFLLSFFRLVSDVRPAFIIWNPIENKIVDDMEDLRQKLKQPEAGISVFNQCVLIFTAPEQDWNVIKEIKKKGFELHITAYRPSDGRMSNSSFLFRYHRHCNPEGPWSESDSEDEDYNHPDDPYEKSQLIGPKNPDFLTNGKTFNIVSQVSMAQESSKKVRIRSCKACKLLSSSQNEEAKSLPLAKPGVHRRKNEILKYVQQKHPKSVGGENDPMTFAEIGGEGGKIVDFKVDPDDLIDIQYSSKQLRSTENGVQIKLEADDDEIQVVKLQPQSTEGHLTMPYPPPLASITTGQIVTDDYRMPMLIPTNSNNVNINNMNNISNANSINNINNRSNVPKAIIIRPSQILPPHQQQQLHQLHQQQLQQQHQQQQQQIQNTPQDLSRTSVLHPANSPPFRPSFVITSTGFDTVPQMSTVLETSTNEGSMTNDARFVRTSSGLIELKNYRMIPGQRVFLTSSSTGQPLEQQFQQQQLQPPAQKSLSDPTVMAVQRAVNGVTIGTSLKRPYQSSPPGIRLVSTSSAGNTVTTMMSRPVEQLTAGSSNAITSTGFHIPPNLLKTLQTINQTKLVLGEREKLLPPTKRVQLQK